MADVPSTRNLLETPSVAQSLDGYIASEGEPAFPRRRNLDWRYVLKQVARASLSPRAGEVRVLQRIRRQRIAAIDLAAVEAGREPALALLRGAVGEGVGHDIALRLLSAAGRRRWRRRSAAPDRHRRDRGSCASAGRGSPRRRRGNRPAARRAPGAGWLRPCSTAACCACLHPRQDAELVLHVMADLVGDHIGFRELAGIAARAGAELVLQIVEERRVEIDALIARAIERPHRRLREAATALARRRENSRSFGG